MRNVVQGRNFGFNSRAHGGRDSACAGLWQSAGWFQFTRPRGARRRAHAPNRRTAVSIHAPTGGATRQRPRGASRPQVSIHAPTGGATPVAEVELKPKAFQFTRPRGARQTNGILHADWGVSIHAPTGGATSRARSATGKRGFNSRAHGGRDSPRPCRASRPRGFNSRAHGGRDDAARMSRSPTASFNSRAHGGRDRRRRKSSSPTRFQFTRPRGARRFLRVLRSGRRSFNSRAHGGRDAPRRSPRPPSGGFNSRAHGGRDARPAGRAAGRAVSIHAPTGGATRITARNPPVPSFNSRAHGGRDCTARSSRRRSRRFNSRAHGGRDQCFRCHPETFGVSIHAPTGGATKVRQLAVIAGKFQFTRPRGARPQARSTGVPRSRFNSRAHGGRDMTRTTRRSPRWVSIHAPTGGATVMTGGTHMPVMFQFTRPRGARRVVVLRAEESARFNSRAHGGRDAQDAPRSGSPPSFNSRAHGGRDVRQPARRQ